MPVQLREDRQAEGVRLFVRVIGGEEYVATIRLIKNSTGKFEWVVEVDKKYRRLGMPLNWNGLEAAKHAVTAMILNML